MDSCAFFLPFMLVISISFWGPFPDPMGLIPFLIPQLGWVFMGLVLLLILFIEQATALSSLILLMWVVALNNTGYIHVKDILYNPLHTGMFAITYLTLGVAWTVPRFWFYIRDEKHKREILGIADTQGRERAGKIKTFLWFHKQDIYAWIVFWPLSVVSTMFRDPLQHLFIWIFDTMGDVYINMLNRAIEQVSQK